MARTRQDVLNNLGQNTDETTLTDQELANRLGYYQELSGLPDKQHILNPDLVSQVKGDIRQQAGYVPDNIAQMAAEFLASRIASGQGNNLDLNFAEYLHDRIPGGVSKDQFAGLRTIGSNLTNKYGGRDLNTTKDIPQDLAPDISRVQGLIQARQKKASDQSALEDFNSSLPAELSRGRNDFFSGERDYAANRFNTEIAPEIMQSLNVRGLYDSGDLPSELTRSASGLLSGVEQSQAQAQEADDLFFTNAGYRDTLQKEIDAGRDVTGQITQARSENRVNQENNFQSAQADLKRQLDEELFQRQQERALASQRALDARQAKANRDALTGNLASSIGGAVGEIGGAYFGGPVGAAAGGAAGSGAARGVTGG